ncbi:MAG: SDR family oxidoreductase [Burkholderiaceae bacterium]|nr:SDR family oxidoreductase [Burkholderiaceae bacterium]
MRGLAGKVALVTGAGGPMGRAIATRLAAAGVDLVLSDISGARLGAAAASIEQVRVVSHRADATNRDEARAVAALGIETFGRIDILVNVVGGIRSTRLYTPFLELDEAQWDSTFALNLKPGFHLVHALAPEMLRRGNGRIVNIASVVLAGEAGQADYAAAKAAVASFTRTLAQEFAPHINVNCISPGPIRTTVMDRMPDSELQGFIEKSFLRRLGEASEVADAVAFFSSEESAFVTGEILAVSGGNHPHL